MFPVLFELGPLTIYSLRVFRALGALAAIALQLELKRYGHNKELSATCRMHFRNNGNMS